LPNLFHSFQSTSSNNLPGIGQATALAFARQGVKSFALLDRNPLTDTISKLNQKHSSLSIKPIELDVTSESAVNDSVAATVKEFGRIDYAVNNAGTGGIFASTADTPLEDFQRVLAVNTTGVWLCQRAQLRQMMTQEKPTNPREYRGTIVNMASMLGIVATCANLPSTSYVTSKHATVGLTKADAVHYAAQGIRINAICPGYIATPLLATSTEDLTKNPESTMAQEMVKVPLRRLGLPEEIGDAIAFLSSPASSYIVGTPLVIDGGFTSH
jgi:NAD(P)-dependent dehydrogenase (short-subunit alcohol dehydrogenase family)